MSPAMNSLKLQVHGVHPVPELGLGDVVGQLPDCDLLAVDALAEAGVKALAHVAPEAHAAFCVRALAGLEDTDDLVGLGLRADRVSVHLAPQDVDFTDGASLALLDGVDDLRAEADQRLVDLGQGLLSLTSEALETCRLRRGLRADVESLGFLLRGEV